MKKEDEMKEARTGLGNQNRENELHMESSTGKKLKSC